MIIQKHRVIIVGSGFAGLAMAIRLKQAGIDDFLVLECGHDVGGTWRDNTYPGAACDVPSHLYSFSFAPNPTWSRSFSGQEEIYAYLGRCADRFDVRRHMRFGASMTEARWDDETQTWTISTDHGRYAADVFVSAVGGLSEPKLPDIPGIERFAGTLFHSARWDHEHDLAGERVAVIGTGASSIQFVPEIQPRVGRLHLFQRTPPWIIPRTDRGLTRLERTLYERCPATQKVARGAIYWGRELYPLGFTGKNRLMRIPTMIARKHLARQIPDPALRSRLTPDYTIGCKRILISNDYYPALAQPNVDVVTDGIAEIRERSIVTTDGTAREIDTLICGTGFHTTDFPVADIIRGRGGRSLRATWKHGMEGYKGTTVHGFPNLFLLVGPNTGLGHTSMVFMIESQVNYVMDALAHLARRAAATFDVRAGAQHEYNVDLQQRLERTVWSTGGCASWYVDPSGRITTLWPGFTWRYRRATKRFDGENYRLEARRPLVLGDRRSETSTAEPAPALTGTAQPV